MSNRLSDYRSFVRSLRSRIGYWKSYSLIQFTLSMTRMMKAEKVSGRKLAALLGVSPAQVSKVLSGGENVTIETMAKFADALGAAVHIHVAKKGLGVRWVEAASGDTKDIAAVHIVERGESTGEQIRAERTAVIRKEVTPAAYGVSMSEDYAPAVATAVLAAAPQDDF